MNTKQDLLNILERELEPYRNKTYKELLGYIDKEPIAFEKEIHNKTLQFEISVFLENSDTIVVMGSVDAGGWRSFFPVTTSFSIKNHSDKNIATS